MEILLMCLCFAHLSLGKVFLCLQVNVFSGREGCGFFPEVMIIENIKFLK